MALARLTTAYVYAWAVALSVALCASVHAATSPPLMLKFTPGERLSYEYEARIASDRDAMTDGARVYGLRCAIDLTVVQRVDDGSADAEAWVLALDVSACRALQSSGNAGASGEPRFVPYPPHERLANTYDKPFYIVQTTDGQVLSVYYPPDEDVSALHFKQGVASAFHATLAPYTEHRRLAASGSAGAVEYTALESDETGVYHAQYLVRGTGNVGSQPLRRLLDTSTSPEHAASLARATHVVTKHASSDHFVRLADARGSTRELEVSKRVQMDVDGIAGVVAGVRLSFDAAARDHDDPRHLKGDYQLSGANSPQSHVTGVMRLTAVSQVADDEVVRRRLLASDDPADAATTAAARVHVQAPATSAEHVPDASSAEEAELIAAVLAANAAAAEGATGAGEGGSPATVVLVKGGLLTTGHSETYTGEGELVRDMLQSDTDDDMPLQDLLACLGNPILNNGAQPGGFSFTARQHGNNTRGGSRGECAMRLTREARRRPQLVQAMADMVTADPLSIAPEVRRVVADALGVVGSPVAQGALADLILNADMLESATQDEYIAVLVAVYHVRQPQRELLLAMQAVLPELVGRARDQALMTVGRLGGMAARQAGGEDLAQEALATLDDHTGAVFADDHFQEARRRLLLAVARDHFDSLTEQERMSWLHSVHGWRALEGAEAWQHGDALDRDRWVNTTVWAIAHEVDARGLAPGHDRHGRVLREHAEVERREARDAATGERRVFYLAHGGTVSEHALQQQVIVGNDVVRAVSAYANLGHASTLPRLLALAGTHSKSVVRVAATQALQGFAGDANAERHLVSTFRNEAEHHSVRMQAIEVLTSWRSVQARSVMDVMGVFVDNLDVDWEQCASACALKCVHRTLQTCRSFCANKCGGRAGHEVLAARFLSGHMEVTLEESDDRTFVDTAGAARPRYIMSHRVSFVATLAFVVTTQPHARTSFFMVCDSRPLTQQLAPRTALCVCWPRCQTASSSPEVCPWRSDLASTRRGRSCGAARKSAPSLA